MRTILALVLLASVSCCLAQTAPDQADQNAAQVKSTKVDTAATPAPAADSANCAPGANCGAAGAATSSPSAAGSAALVAPARPWPPPWWDLLWPAYGFLALGIIASILGLWFLALLKRQIRATEIAASAATASAEAMMNGERPWVLVKSIKLLQFLPTARGATGPTYPILCSMYFKNYGRTPALIKNNDVRFVLIKSLSDLPPEPEFGLVTNHGDTSPVVLAPNETSVERLVYMEPKSVLDDIEVRSIREGQSLLCAYGYVNYSDAFGRSHETRFCYVYHFPLGQDASEEFRIDGPDSYSRVA